MLNVLFWNMNGLDRERLCATIAHSQNATVVVLAECTRPNLVQAELNPVNREARYQLLPKPLETRVHVFSCLPPKAWIPVAMDRYIAIYRLDHWGSEELLLCAVHLPSKLIPSDRDQDGILRRLGQSITEVETQRGHTRTLLVGDFNADPFQYGVYSSDGLHAMPTRKLAEQQSRTVGGRSCRFFFNPMWRFFSDATPGPPGTYFWRQARPDCRFWYVLDQILLRPSLLPYFEDKNLEILTAHEQLSFTSAHDDRPIRKVASDHFPVLIRLNYPGV